MIATSIPVTTHMTIEESSSLTVLLQGSSLPRKQGWSLSPTESNGAVEDVSAVQAL